MSAIDSGRHAPRVTLGSLPLGHRPHMWQNAHKADVKSGRGASHGAMLRCAARLFLSITVGGEREGWGGGLPVSVSSAVVSNDLRLSDGRARALLSQNFYRTSYQWSTPPRKNVKGSGCGGRGKAGYCMYDSDCSTPSFDRPRHPRTAQKFSRIFSSSNTTESARPASSGPVWSSFPSTEKRGIGISGDPCSLPCVMGLAEFRINLVGSHPWQCVSYSKDGTLLVGVH